MFKSLLARAYEARADELDGGEGSLEGGFTLIELMVVLLIIAILLAIAIPTFLGVSGSAQQRSAQSSATNAMTNAIAYYQNGQTFDATPSSTSSSQGHAAGSTSVALQSAEPAFTWSDIACTTATSGKCVSVAPFDASTSNDGQAIVVATMSKDGTCWFEANLQATPAVTATTGFVQTAYNATHAAGMQIAPAGAADVSTAGTYYAELKNPGANDANCQAAYVETDTAGFTWGNSFSSPGVNAS